MKDSLNKASDKTAVNFEHSIDLFGQLCHPWKGKPAQPFESALLAAPTAAAGHPVPPIAATVADIVGGNSVKLTEHIVAKARVRGST